MCVCAEQRGVGGGGGAEVADGRGGGGCYPPADASVHTCWPRVSRALQYRC